MASRELEKREEEKGFQGERKRKEMRGRMKRQKITGKERRPLSVVILSSGGERRGEDMFHTKEF